jgi:hypothetical protein
MYKTVYFFSAECMVKGSNIEEEWEANELILPDITDF